MLKTKSQEQNRYKKKTHHKVSDAEPRIHAKNLTSCTLNPTRRHNCQSWKGLRSPPKDSKEVPILEMSKMIDHAIDC